MMAMPAPCPPPPFNAAAQAHAKSIAAAAGKPKTRCEGLAAIHAVLHCGSFGTERAAWEAYGASKQRFYEWKKLLAAHLNRSKATPATATIPALPVLGAAPRPQPYSWDDCPDSLEDEPGFNAWCDARPRSLRPKDQQLLTSDAWVEENTPNLTIQRWIPGGQSKVIEYANGDKAIQTYPGGPPGIVYVGSPVLTPDLRHFERHITCDASSPGGTSHMYQEEALLVRMFERYNLKPFATD